MFLLTLRIARKSIVNDGKTIECTIENVIAAFIKAATGIQTFFARTSRPGVLVVLIRTARPE